MRMTPSSKDRGGGGVEGREREREQNPSRTSNKRLEKFFSDIILLVGILKGQTKFIALQSFYFLHCKMYFIIRNILHKH